VPYAPLSVMPGIEGIPVIPGMLPIPGMYPPVEPGPPMPPRLSVPPFPGLMVTWTTSTGMAELAQLTRSFAILRWSTTRTMRTGIILNSAKGAGAVAASGMPFWST
jgi:hypothetical protein